MAEEQPDTQSDEPEPDPENETVEEYVESIENDPAHNPDDPEMERVRGG